MVTAKKSMLPGAVKTSKGISNLTSQVLNKSDAFSENVGIPSTVLRQHTEYRRKSNDSWKGDHGSWKEHIRKNKATSPIGKYIKSWTKMNPDKAKVFIKDPYNYKKD